MRGNRKVSLRTLAAHLCREWRILLLIAVLCGAAAAVYQTVRLWPKTKIEKSETQKNQPTAKEKKTTSFYEEEIRRINSQITTRQEYIADSIYTQLDFSKVGLASVDLFVFLDTDLKPDASGQTEDLSAEEKAALEQAEPEEGTELAEGMEETEGTEPAEGAEEETGGTEEGLEGTEEETEDSSDQEEDTSESLRTTEPQDSTVSLRRRRIIYRAYQRYINNMIDWTELAEKFETEPRYLQELLKVTNENEILGAMTISVRYTDPEGADEILQYVIDALARYPHSDLYEAGNFEIHYKNRIKRYHIDAVNYKLLNRRVSELNSLMQTKDSFQTNINKNRASSSGSSVHALSKKAVLKSAVKYGAAGAAGSLIVAAVLFVFYLLSRSAVLSGREINEVYGFDRIAVMPVKDAGKLRGLDRAAAALDASCLSSSNMKDGCKVADANLKALAEENEQIALIGDCTPERLSEVADLIGEVGTGGYTLRAISDLNSNAASLEALRECSSVVIASEVRKSTYRNTDDLLATVRSYRKPVVGSIVLC